MTKNKRIHTDTKNAKAKCKRLVQTNNYLQLDKEHKDWYDRHNLGKQRNKPDRVAKEEKKQKKTWKNKE
jgi:regulator of replication initiation timing